MQRLYPVAPPTAATAIADRETLRGVSDVSAVPPAVDPLVGEATKKTAIIWLAVPGAQGPARPVWHVWHDDAAWVLTGGIEQQVAGLVEHPTVRVIVRSKDKWTRLVVWVGTVELVEPGSPAWDEVVPLLKAARLNSPDGEQAPSRWARECQLVRLMPTGELLEEPGRMTTGSHAAPPPVTGATTPVRIPFTFHRRARRRRQAN